MNKIPFIHDYYMFYNFDNSITIIKWNKNIPVKNKTFARVMPSFTFIKAEKNLLGRTLSMVLSDCMKPITEEQAMLEIL